MITLDPAKLAASGVSIASRSSASCQANNLTFPSGQLSDRRDEDPGLDDRPARRPSRRSRTSSSASAEPAPAAPAAPGRLRGPGASAAPVAPAAPTPITIGDLGTVEIDAVATTGYGRTNGKPSLTPDGHQDVRRQHRRRRRGRPGQARRDRRPPPGRADRHDRRPTCPTSSRSRATACSARAASGALFAVLTIFLFLFSLRSTIVAADQHPAVDPDRARDHAAHRDHASTS